MLPVAIGACAVAIVLVVWAAAKAVEMTSEHRAFIIAMAAAVLIGVAAQLPAAVASARDYCSSLAESSQTTPTLGGFTYTTEGVDSPANQFSDCANVWPRGPG